MNTKDKNYIKYNENLHFSEITIHGRFQPPLHRNHYEYINNAFKISDKAHILITNPYLDDDSRKEALHRSANENNPFTYEQRVKIFKSFFDQKDILESKYDFAPFEITKDEAWDKLDKSIPNMVNTYSEWSNKKLDKFLELGFIVVHSNIPRAEDISGTKIRTIIAEKISMEEKREKLVDAGYMQEALDGLFEVI